MYSLEFLLNTEGKDSVTSGVCLWKRRQRASIKPCDVKDVNISKCEYGEPSKKREHEYVWLQNIDHDPREERFRKEKSHDDMVKFTSAMKKQVSSYEPAIFPLLRKLYLPDDVPKATSLAEMLKSLEKSSCIMENKIEQFIQDSNSSVPTAEKFLNYLSFSDSEIIDVEHATVDQWESEDWFLHKVGFISASKCKAVFTSQTEQSRNHCLAKSIVSKPSYNMSSKKTHELDNPRDWGLVKEEARKCYMYVAGRQHHKIRLERKGFQISKKKPFLGASVDNIRNCKCSPDCGITVVEYKCPWVHRNSDPKEAFLSKEIGGIFTGDSYHLQNKSKYYYQVQMQLFVVCAKFCDFVVWTTKGIHIISIPFESSFMSSVCINLEKFWVTQVVPLLLANQLDVPCTDNIKNISCDETASNNMATSNDMGASSKRTDVDEMDISPTIKTHSEGSYCMHNIISTVWERGPYSTPQIYLQESATSFLVRGVDLHMDDISTLEQKVMMNDSIVKVLLE
ncbi:Carboxypeptidase D [Paramuricea clavata]|uniref:Carboxypeptidase D n=1 Tax=Paramuricea clavata TaxID=317549 RepID=A0A6S7GAP3_PARCT|nr:Carboxypeptidase D [Paramuricea clavata]